MSGRRVAERVASSKVADAPSVRAPAPARRPTWADGAALAEDAVAGGGAPLDAGVRRFYEHRLGHDFSQVRVHDTPPAAEAADAIGARAYTIGNDIAFARGELAPSSAGGARLLAHELVHVVQAAHGARPDVIARQAAPFRQRTFADRAGGGTTDFQETVQNAPTQAGNVVSGRVDRAEIAPAAGGQPRQTIHSGSVNVQFDTQACRMTLPYTFNFVPQATAGPPICQEPPNATAVTAPTPAEVQRIGQQYVDRVNAGLRGAFTARITGCANACADRDIAIDPAAVVGATNPDTTVNVVNRGGRGDAGTICMRDNDAGFATHESGHQVLGMGDEYREDDAGLLRQMPQWGRNERVRTDLTRMGSEASYGRFAMFQERHFRFARVFLEAAFPGCNVALQAITRRPPDFRLELLAGGAYYRAGAGTETSGGNYVGGAFNVGLPFNRLRTVEARLGVQGIYLQALAPLDRRALLLGVTAGIEARTSPAGWGFTAGAQGSAGYLRELGTLDPSRNPSAGYVEGGGSIGLTTPMLMSGFRFQLRGEAAGGVELTSNPDALRWFRVGVGFGATF